MVPDGAGGEVGQGDPQDPVGDGGDSEEVLGGSVVALDIYADLLTTFGPSGGHPQLMRVNPEGVWDRVSSSVESSMNATNRGVFDVTLLGAVGDGSTDDTAAIDAAYTAAAAYAVTYGGATLFFPAGTYRRSSTLTISQAGVKVEGDGITTSVIKFTDTSTETGPLVLFTHATQLNGCGISDIEIHGNYDGGQTTSEACVKCINTRWFRADNIRARESAGKGIYTDTTSTASTTNTQSNFYTRIFTYENRGIGQHYKSEKNSQWVMLRSELDCAASTDGTAGIVLGSASTTTIKETTECSVTNVRVSDSGRFGVIFDGITKYTCSDFMIHNSMDSGVQFRSSNADGTTGSISYSVFSTFSMRNNANDASMAGWAGIETDENNCPISHCALIGWVVTGANTDASSPGVFDIGGWQDCSFASINAQNCKNLGFLIHDGEALDGQVIPSRDLDFTACSANSNGSGVYIESSSSLSDDTRNIRWNGGGLSNEDTDGSSFWEFYVEADVLDVIISNADIDAETHGGEIKVESGAENQVRVSGCSFRSSNGSITAASTAALVIPPEAYDGMLLVTGTADITSIVAPPNGTRVVLVFQGNAATNGVVDGSNLVLSGNFAYTADDTLSLVSTGTNMIETGRSVN